MVLKEAVQKVTRCKALAQKALYEEVEVTALTIETTFLCKNLEPNRPRPPWDSSVTSRYQVRQFSCEKGQQVFRSPRLSF